LLPGMPGSPWSYVKSLSLTSVADTPRAPGDPVGGREPRRLGRLDDRGALRGRLRRGRRGAPPPDALPPRRVVGRVLRALPRRAAPRRDDAAARVPRPDPPCAHRGAVAPPARRPLLRLERAGAREGGAGGDDPVRAPSRHALPAVPARAVAREAR